MDYGMGGSTKAERWAQKKAAIVSRRDAPQSPVADKKSIGQMTDEELQKEFELKSLELNRQRYGAESAFNATNIGKPVGGQFGFPQRTVGMEEMALIRYVARLAGAIRDRKKQKEFSEREQQIRSQYGV